MMKPALKHQKATGGLEIVRTQCELSATIEKWKACGLKICLVPTMGALHEGHLSLIKLAKKISDRVVVSIFVNPTQFAPHEDFSRYPRQEQKDAVMLDNAGAHLAYFPEAKEIYPGGPVSTMKAGKEAQGLEGDLRPTHFDGVVTVVHRLFEQIRPDIAIFGEKDFQQLQVIKEMAATQNENMRVEIIGAPIMRDEYGLALSSRNAYLTDAELQVARQLNKILSVTAVTGDTQSAITQLLKAGFYKVDYVETRWSRILAAVWIGKTRLIDNQEKKNEGK